MHKVLLDGISDKMSALVQNGKYGAINTVDPTTIGYYIVKFLSGTCILQDDKKIDMQVIKAGELIPKADCLSILKANINCYWQQLENKESV